MGATTAPAVPGQKMILPLALAQFISTYAASSLNVAIDPIATDLHTTIYGVQTTITLFSLTMAALMIPGSKLTDIWGRKTCLVIGLILYGIGALLSAVTPGLGLMIVGNSFLEGIGSALMIPPIYILVTVAFPDLATRAKYFGVISAAAGLGAATGPLIGGAITSALSWRYSFVLQVLVIVVIILLARDIPDIPRHGPAPRFDMTGAVLSALGLFFLVSGILQTSQYGWGKARKDFKIGNTVVISKGGISPIWIFVGLGVVILAGFFWHLYRTEKAGGEPLLHLRLFRRRTANLGLGTQIAQWLTIQGVFFVTSVFLQQERGYGAIQTGLILTPATIGILASSSSSERFARRRAQRTVIVAGFAITVLGMVLLPALVRQHSNVATFIPGLFFIGLGVGAMLTSSVNVVQSAFPEQDQGDISGLSRSVSNLGSSLGTALAGSVLIAASHPGQHPYIASLVVIGSLTLIGLALAVLLPHDTPHPAAVIPRPTTPHP